MIIGNSPPAPSDLVRQLVNLSANSGRCLQSSQTGFVHYCYRQLDYPTYDTIPLYENFLFALALLRERTAESFAEGKALIQKLLPFQSSNDTDGSAGNFPVYLHEYPVCRDRTVGPNILPILYWVLRTFPLVLGSPLREEFQLATERLLSYCLSLRDERVPFVTALKIACAAKALGTFWDKQDLIDIGRQWLDTLLAQTRTAEFSAWLVPSTAGEALIALEMVYPNLATSPWNEFWDFLHRTWHAPTASYAGPGFHDYQFAEQPEVTLLDLILGFHTGSYSYRALLSGPHLLQAAVIHPTDERLPLPELPAKDQGVVAGRNWELLQGHNWACSAIEKHRFDPSRDNALSPFRLLWGDLNCAHTFVCQGGNVECVDFEFVEGGVDLLLTLPVEIPNEVRQRNREVLFFLDAAEDVMFTVANQVSATTFQIGEAIQIKSAGMNISLTLRCASGTGHFFGHIAKGNRPSQKHTTADGRFKSYDWQLFLRTVDREAQCKIRAEIRFHYDQTQTGEPH